MIGLSTTLQALLISTTSSQKYFDASKPGEGALGHFDFVINGKYRMTLDTGASATWIKLASITPGGFRVRPGTPILSHYNEVQYPFQGNLVTTMAVMATIDAGRGIRWRQLLPLVDKDQDAVRGIGTGVIGSDYGSAFVKANPVLTIVPHKTFYRIYAEDNVSLTSEECIVVPVSEMGRTNGMWMMKDVTLRLSSGHSMVLNFEVDTGFSVLALPDYMWEHFHYSIIATGAELLTSGDGRVHRYSNCQKRKMPSITYAFGTQRKQFKIPPSSYTTFNPDGTCDVYVIKHDTGFYEGMELSFIGVPVLKSVVTQLNRRSKTVSFCPLPPM